MTVRHAVLAAGAVLVLGLAVYLLIKVGAPPVVDHATAGGEPTEPVRTVSAPSVAGVADAASPAKPKLFVPPSIALQHAPADQASPPVPAVATPDSELSGPKLDAVMDEANKAYDRGDYDDAKVIAGRVLGKLPTNVRMLRIMVSSSCIDGDSAVAQTFITRLPPVDQEQMKVRCARYGIAFADKP